MLNKLKITLGVVVHAFDPHIQEAEGGRSLRPMPARPAGAIGGPCLKKDQKQVVRKDNFYSKT